MPLGDETSLCINYTLAEYISRTENLRFNTGSFVSKLFISLIRPYKPVSSATVVKWIKLVLSGMGIYTF